MRITNLEKRFPGFTLNIDDLRFEPGQIHGLIGPNGSGKTTAMKLMAGLMEPDRGGIDYEGLSAREMTMVPRKPYLLHGSVRQNLVYPLAVRGIKPERETVERYLDLAGLTGRGKKYAPSLSSGEQQKLALARALIFGPKLILIDEALANLDIESVAVFERVILERQREMGVTFVVISHQLAHIERLCGRVLFMDRGRIAAKGTAAKMLHDPENTALRRYLRHEAMNTH